MEEELRQSQGQDEAQGSTSNRRENQPCPKAGLTGAAGRPPGS
jgi:hypothetical protein